MDWDLLKIFLAVAHTGTLNGAARQLGINHSTAFRRLNALEQDLAGRVFERISGGYQLTPMGESLLSIAEGIAAGFSDLERTVIGKDIQPRGLVKITAPNNLAYEYLPGYLASFNNAYPEIRTEILVSNMEINMNNRQADIALRVTPEPAPHLVGSEVCRLPWEVYGTPKLIKRYGRPKKLKDLINLPVIGGSGNMRNLPAFQWIDKHLSQSIVHRCDDLVAMRSLLCADLGFAILPRDQLRPSINPILNFEHAPASKLWVLTHPELRNAERIRLMMRHLKEAFTSDPIIGVRQ